jgi:RNA polymerase sigma-70 factor, ECF subfamily
MAVNVAFDILYREYYVRVFGLCRRLLNSTTLAEDATQETFMRAYRKFNRYDTSKPFWQWISSISSNHCIDLLRQKNRQEALFGEETDEQEQIISTGDEPLTAIMKAENAGILAPLVQELPDKYRVPLILSYFNGSSYDEIADDLSISRNHVGVLLLRAKQQLRKSLDEMGVAAQ